MKKFLFPLLAVAVLFTSTGASYAFAANAYDLNVNHQDDQNLEEVLHFSVSDTFPQLIVTNPDTRYPQLWVADEGSGIWLSKTDHEIELHDIPQTNVTDLTSDLSTINSSLSTLTSGISTLTSSISTTDATVAGLGTPLNIGAFMSNNASTTPYLVSTSTNGFMSPTDKAKVDGILAWSWSSPSRSIVTGTGATGFQPSATRTSTIRENVKVTTTASIAGNADGYIALEMAPTNSATAGDWVEVGRCGNSQALTLAITLQSVQGTTCQLTADVPPGYYAKLRSVTTTGTVSFAFVSAQEVLK